MPNKTRVFTSKDRKEISIINPPADLVVAAFEVTYTEDLELALADSFVSELSGYSKRLAAFAIEDVVCVSEKVVRVTFAEPIPKITKKSAGKIHAAIKAVRASAANPTTSEDGTMNNAYESNFSPEEIVESVIVADLVNDAVSDALGYSVRPEDYLNWIDPVVAEDKKFHKAVEELIGVDTTEYYETAARLLDKVRYELGLNEKDTHSVGGVKLDHNIPVPQYGMTTAQFAAKHAPKSGSVTLRTFTATGEKIVASIREMSAYLEKRPVVESNSRGSRAMFYTEAKFGAARIGYILVSNVFTDNHADLDFMVHANISKRDAKSLADIIANGLDEIAEEIAA